MRWIVVVMLCACGGAQVAVKGPATKGYAPFEFAADAADPGKAVMLASGGRASAVVELRAEGRVEIAVAGGKVVLGVRVGTAVGGKLESAIAAEAAARVLGKSVESYEWSVSGEAGVEAEAAMAAGFVACLTGAEVRDDVAVIGSVLPDGSVGVVAGLPEKIEAMVAVGKKRIGVAAGGVVKRAEVVAVADVGAAYALMTGVKLPEAVEEEMGVVGVEGAYGVWQQRLVGEWAALLLLDNEPRLPAKVAQLAREAQRSAKIAEELKREGKWSAALEVIEEAWVASASAMTVFRVVELVRGGQVEAAVKLVTGGEGGKRAAAAVGAVDEAKVATSGAQLQRLTVASGALGALAGAQALGPEMERAVVALGELKKQGALANVETGERVAAAVTPLVTAERRVIAAAAAALLALEVVDGGGGPARSAEELRRAAPGAAAVARWRASLAGVHDIEDPAAALLPMMETLPLQLIEERARWGEPSAPWQLLSWALSFAAMQQVAVSRVRRLGLAPGEPMGSDATAAFAQAASGAALLAVAERHARQAAARSKVAFGAVPLAQVLAYQLGRQLASRAEPELKARALTALWWSSALGDAALRLARATYVAPVPKQ